MAGGRGGGPRQQQGSGQVLSKILRTVIFWYMSSQTFGSKKPNDPALLIHNLVPKGQRLDMWLYLSEQDVFTEFGNEKALAWHESSIPYAVSGSESMRFHHLVYDPSEIVRRNTSVYVHTFFSRSGYKPDPNDPEYDPWSFSQTHCVVIHLPKPKVDKRKSLLSSNDAEQGVSETLLTVAEPEEEEASPEYVPFWKPHVTINLVEDFTRYSKDELPPHIAEKLVIDKDTGNYFPTIFYNEFWLLKDKLVAVNESVTQLELNLELRPIGLTKWQLFLEIDQSFQIHRDDGSILEEEADELKSVFLEGNPYQLVSTMCVSLLHTVFDVLAFKNGHVLAEALLVVIVIYLLLQKSYQPEKRPLTLQEVNQLCEEWSPENLHPPITPEMEIEVPVIESTAGPRTIVNGEEVVNLSTANYLGLMGDKRVLEACRTTLEKYGVGACGPRGFYGTIDVHLDCEAKISEFMGTTDSILYSYGLATAPSTIPAFCKRGDLILADEGVHWGIQNGLYLSRSTVKLFKHNDMASLESLLVKNDEEDKRTRKVLSRRFIVAEAIYQNSGQMAPLHDLIRLKEKYRFRLVLDESNSIGVLGQKGRGLTEHCNISVEKVDIITAAMGHALASVGGFCTGSTKVVDHQRLSGLGYVFSASLPPYVATASISAINLLQENPELVSKLQQNVAIFRKALSDTPGLVISSHRLSPTIFMHLKQTHGSFKEDFNILQRISEKMLTEESVLVSVTRRSVLDKCMLPAALKLGVSAGHTESDLLAAAASIRRVAASILLESDCTNGHYELIR